MFVVRMTMQMRMGVSHGTVAMPMGMYQVRFQQQLCI